MINAKEKFINFLNGVQTPTYGVEIDNALSLLPVEQRQDFVQGLNGGNVDIAQKQKQLGISSPQTQEEISLAKAGQFNKPEMVRQGGLIQGYNQGYNLNYDNPTNTVGTRIGQAVGTLGRAIDTPLGRGLIAYGLSNAVGDTNPLEQALTAGVGRQTNLTKDKVYRNQLKQLGMTDEELNAIKGNVTKDIFEGVTSGMRLGNQRMTFGQLAQFDEEVAQMVANNPALANQFIPINYARDVYGRKRDTAEGKMAKVAAETKKIEEETKHVGKPKVTVNIKKGGTNSTITHVGGENNPTQPTDAGIVRVQAPNGQTGTIPRARLREAIKAGYKVI